MIRVPAQAVHQHKYAFGAQMAKVDLACARGNTAAVGWEAEVAAAVEPRVERRPGHGEAGEHVAQ